MPKDSKYGPVPGRGLNTQKAINLRRDFLTQQGYDISELIAPSLTPTDVRNNIESFIGSTVIPLGLVGPITHKNKNTTEGLYGIVGTLEGALVASMNRGAKAIRESGGFASEFIHQYMVRAPLFLCKTEEITEQFSKWILEHEKEITDVAESFSNHARLKRIEHIKDRDCLHLKFYYETGDASGQNMTTTCTWHAILHMVDRFKEETGIQIEDFVLEGNGASDKKATRFLTDEGVGRGVRIKVECEIPEDIVERVLRTTSHQLLKFHAPARRQTIRDGMMGYNINVANAVAGFFASTGQDLASIHESSLADLVLEPTENGLKASLTLYSLVIGTIGGGTGLPAQKTALELMGCYGVGGLMRFATIIAGFALALELSTNSAMVSGQFALAHERLGRNKPTQWLTRSEFDESFMRSFIKTKDTNKINSIQVRAGDIDTGILMNLTKRSINKLIGFIPIEATLESGEHLQLLIKSKALDHEVVKGIHNLSAAIDPELAEMVGKYWKNLEYVNSHLKELEISEWMSNNFPDVIPTFYGATRNPEREIFMFCSEDLSPKSMISMDSENRPSEWTPEHIDRCIEDITRVHFFYRSGDISSVHEFDVMKSIPLYEKFIQVIRKDYPDQGFEIFNKFLTDIQETRPEYPKSIVHNDFNPRNVAIRKDGRPCIYDWELSVINYPHRDIVEFLCFTLPEDFSQGDLMRFIEQHFSLLQNAEFPIDRKDHYRLSVLMIKEFLITRMTFYKAASILLKLKFVDRVINNALRMIQILEKEAGL